MLLRKTDNQIKILPQKTNLKFDSQLRYLHKDFIREKKTLCQAAVTHH